MTMNLRPTTQAKLDRLVAMAEGLGWTVQDNLTGQLKIAKQPPNPDLLTGLPVWHGRRYVIHYGVGILFTVHALDDYTYEPKGYAKISLAEALRRLGKDVVYAELEARHSEEGS